MLARLGLALTPHVGAALVLLAAHPGSMHELAGHANIGRPDRERQLA
jgi:hypothetical protein